MTVQNFEDLNVWKQARQLTQDTYRLTRTERFSKDFGLRDQIQRAAVSIMSNIAEDSKGVGIKSFFNSYMLRRLRAVKQDRKFMSHLTRAM